MHRFAHPILTLLMAGLIGWCFTLGGTFEPPDDQTPPPPDDQAEATPERPVRVILHLARTEPVQGILIRDDSELIIVQTKDGHESFVKSRIIRTVRLVEPEPGQEGVVFMRDGSRRRGTILRDEFEYVLIENEGIKSRINRSVVDHVQLLPTVEERYLILKESLNPESQDSWLDLCRWLVSVRRYDLANTELQELLRRHPNSADARRMQVVVEAQLRLQDAANTARDADARDGAPLPNRPDSRGRVDDDELLPSTVLSREDVNIIRVFEIDFERPPNVVVPQEIIRELILRYGTHRAMPANADARNALFRAPAIDVVRLMFEVQARDLYHGIEVQSEPYALNLFRQRVHNTWLISNCSTSQCHGGVNAGRFFLHRRNFDDERVRYTNLLILERLRLPDQPPLINYDEPMNSLIIQHALPRTEARFPHPDVPGWNPAFNRANVRMLDDAIRWIQSMYYPPRPQYPVEYDPPMLRQSGSDAVPADGRLPR